MPYLNMHTLVIVSKTITVLQPSEAWTGALSAIGRYELADEAPDLSKPSFSTPDARGVEAVGTLSRSIFVFSSTIYQH